MAEFTPITTQEQLDKVIGERIAGVKAKYEGFDGQMIMNYWKTCATLIMEMSLRLQIGRAHV